MPYLKCPVIFGTSNYPHLSMRIITLILFFYIPEHILFSDLEKDYGLKHEYLDHVGVYNRAVEQVTTVSQKLRKLQKERNPGGDDIWP